MLPRTSKIGGVATDYVYGKEESTVTAGRDAYKVTIGPSASYKKKLAQGLKEDYVGRSRIEVFYDKATGLPIRVVRTIDNYMFKYSTAMTLDLYKDVEFPVKPSDDIKPVRRYYRQIFLPSEIEKYGFLTLGSSHNGLTGRPVVLGSTDTASWIASASYQKGRDGFIVLQAKRAQYGSAKERFLNYINGISEEVTVTEHRGRWFTCSLASGILQLDACIKNHYLRRGRNVPPEVMAANLCRCRATFRSMGAYALH